MQISQPIKVDSYAQICLIVACFKIIDSCFDSPNAACDEWKIEVLWGQSQIPTPANEEKLPAPFLSYRLQKAVLRFPKW